MNPAGEHCVQDWEMENEAFVMATFLYQFKQLNYHHLCFQAVTNQSNPGFSLIISELLKVLVTALFVFNKTSINNPW